MTIEFSYKRAPKMRIATVAWTGAWSEKKIRSEFEALQKWATAAKLKPGRWVFIEPGMRSWRVGIEVRGPGRGSGRIRIRTLPATRVASVTFDPDVVSPMVIYHGIYDWLRWQKREKKIGKVGTPREIYSANPWTVPKAWASTEIQVVVR